ncbi:MAG: nitrate/nitrite transporter [Hyphomicrobiaceae bacterium]
MVAPTAGHGSPRAGLVVLLLALGPFGAGYFLSYLFRAVNAVVAPDLVRDLNLSAGDLGLLTAAYLFAFALFQLPLGILLDRYGPRRVQAALVFVGGLGALMFSYGSDATTLTVARALIGLGFAGGLMAGFKAVVIWVPAERRAFANALVMSAGAVGLIVSTSPAEAAIAQFGWRNVFLLLAGITFLTALAILVLVPDHGSQGVSPAALRTQVRQLGRILTDRVFLAIVPLLALTAGAQIAIQTLWAGPWLRDVAGMSRDQVADMLALAAVAFLVGVLASGAVADWLQRRGVSLLTTMLAFLIVFFGAQIAIILELTAYNALIWFAFGMCGQVAVLGYPWLAQHFGSELAGRSNAGVNVMMFGAAFFIQYAIGIIIDMSPQSATGGYPPDAYRAAFGVFLLVQIIALVWYVANLGLIRRTEQAFRRS